LANDGHHNVRYGKLAATAEGFNALTTWLAAKNYRRGGPRRAAPRESL